MDWGFVTDRLSTTFRNEKWIGAHERRFISETLYGLVRHLRRIDLALERGRRTKKSPRDLERLLALLVLEKLLDPAAAARVEPDLDWRAVATVDDAIAAERNVTTRIALASSLPDWLAKRFVADWGSEAEPLARALNERAPMTVRANTLVTSRDALAKELAQAGLATRAGAWSDTALVVESRTNLFAQGAFKRGAMEAQDEGSQLLAELAHRDDVAKPLVIDYCAGAGGKTLAIAARLGNRGRVIATDVDAAKLEELRKRARRAGVSNVQAVQLEQGAWPRELDSVRGKADVVFVDAPCSGTGALRRNPEARWRLREQEIEGFRDKQLAIMKHAIELAAPGARVVYATCSLLAAENEHVARSLTGVDLADLRTVLADRADALAREGTFTVTPHVHGTDGFYARIMTRAR
jgi:16S rRNA (cytosine967-C5)-methyltransferase